MKLSLIILFLVSFMSGCKKDTTVMSVFERKAKDPAFLKNSYIDSDISEIRKKYQGNVQSYSCNKDDSKACKEKNIKCVCYDVVLARTQQYAQDIYLTVSSGKTVGTFFSTNVGTNLYFQLETAQSVFGDEAPVKIYEEKGDSRGYKTVALVWDLKEGGHVFSMAHCPISNSGVKKAEYRDSVRNCKVQKTSMNRLRKFEKSDRMQESNLKY